MGFILLLLLESLDRYLPFWYLTNWYLVFAALNNCSYRKEENTVFLLQCLRFNLVRWFLTLVRGVCFWVFVLLEACSEPTRSFLQKFLTTKSRLKFSQKNSIRLWLYRYHKNIYHYHERRQLMSWWWVRFF